MTKSDYHFASISEITRNVHGCNISIGTALKALTEAKILNARHTGKMILYMRNQNSNFITAFEATTKMIEVEQNP
jgi:hypothetical protein